MTRKVQCDLKFAKGSKHRGLFKFRVPDEKSTSFIYVCSDCLGLLVRRQWSRTVNVMANISAKDEANVIS